MPTDFSDNSKNALHYAISLSAKVSGHIDVVHFYETIRKTGHLKSMDQILKDEAEAEMEKLIAGVTPLLMGDSSIAGKVYKGFPAEMTAKLAEEKQVDMIVMGTQGSSGALEVFIGSTAMAVVRKSRQGTLVIPKEAEYLDVKDIVFAIDKDNFSNDMLMPLLTICEAFDANLYLLHVSDLDENLSCPAFLGSALKGCAFSYHTRTGHNVFKSIEAFSKEVDADLIAMVRQKKSLLQKVFTESHTRKELFHTKLPLLIMHEQ